MHLAHRTAAVDEQRHGQIVHEIVPSHRLLRIQEQWKTQRLRARMQVQGLDKDGADADRAVERERNARLAGAGGDLPIGALGSGSDYSAYLQHLGLASLDIEYEGEDDQDGVYHSNFDSFDHYVRFGDPTFAYGVAEAKTVGHLVLRMADAPVLPLQFTGVADTLTDYVTQLRKLTGVRR